MARINDVGGMVGFPLIDIDETGPPFHADWEAHVVALNAALVGRGVYTLDEFRDAVERIPPERYLAASYYEKWFLGITTLLTEKGLASSTELAGSAELAGPAG